MKRETGARPGNALAAALLGVLLLAAPAGTRAAREPVVLEYWHFYSGTLDEIHRDLVEEFNRTHPGIRVEPAYGGSTWTMRDKLLVALSAGAGPDVASIDPFWTPQLAAGGYLVPADDFVAGTPGLLEDVLPLYWENARYDGRIWSVPFAASSQVLYYNRDLMARVGLSETDVPRTWGDLLALGRRVETDPDGDGRPDLWILDVPTTAQTGVVYDFIITLWQRGGELFAPDLSRVAFHSPEGVETLTFWQEMVRSGVLDLRKPDHAWESGRVLFQFASSARVRSAYGTLPFDFGVASLPYDRFRVTGIGGRNLAVLARDPRRHEHAWTFVRWMTSPEVNLRWSAATGYAPLRRSSYASEQYQRTLEEDPRLRVALDEMLYARARPNVPAYGDVSRVLGEAVERALYRDLDPEPLLARAAREADAVLETYRRQGD